MNEAKKRDWSRRETIALTQAEEGTKEEKREENELRKKRRLEMLEQEGNEAKKGNWSRREWIVLSDSMLE